MALRGAVFVLCGTWAHGHLLLQEVMRGISPWACPTTTEYLVGKCPKHDLRKPLAQAHTNTESRPGNLDPGPLWHLILAAQFLSSSPQRIPAHALVDSGATTNYVDMTFAAKYAQE